MMHPTHLIRASMWTALTVLAMTAAACATQPSAAGPPGPGPHGMRQEMAAAHERMAACLRSDRDIGECRAQLHQSCRAAMGEQACPMMDMTGDRHGAGRQGPPPSEPKQQR